MLVHKFHANTFNGKINVNNKSNHDRIIYTQVAFGSCLQPDFIMLFSRC